MAAYMFRDSAGKGFDHALEVDGKLYFAYGTWIPNNEHKHSNNKELRNLVNSVIKVYEAGI
jgi:hypothetical protein